MFSLTHALTDALIPNLVSLIPTLVRIYDKTNRLLVYIIRCRQVYDHVREGYGQDKQLLLGYTMRRFVYLCIESDVGRLMICGKGYH